MTAFDIVEAITAVVLLAIAAWEWRQLLRHPQDIALRVLTAGLTVIALVVTLSTPIAVFEPLHAALDVIFFSNIAWSAIIYCYSVFFLLARLGGAALGAGRRKVEVEFLWLLCSIAVMFLVTKTAPPGTWHTPRIPEDYRTWRNIVFYLSVDGYCMVIWVLGTWRALAYLRQLKHRWARIAVAAVIAGATGMVLAVNGISLLRQGLYIAFPGSTWPALRTYYNIGRLGGQVLLAAGLAAVPLAALLPRLWDRIDEMAKRRYVRQMTPLWERLTSDFSYVVLPEFAGETASRRATVRFERMTAEITDALAELAPYCSHESPSGLADPQEAAAAIDAALTRVAEDRAARWAGAGYEPRMPPYPMLEPDFGSRWRAQAQWMIRVGQSLPPSPDVREKGPGDELSAI
ncbi:MAB_1171c family putative transporter [Pseudonocardia sp. N23]|uniref:MAB_1171c family putative transporter n=1 Tax=Pseudonocardia sp. N23 TaxID=1987376 RepID=UPI000BFD6088|nr:MAB_1171c family putative transporter [Pseudonocardia sp. N23]